MPTRTLLCIEPDEAAVAVIRGALAPYGFQVENVPNGEQAIEWARKTPPEIIVVSVEPRKVGYAICNKLKRSPDLQSIPVILTSSEETLQTFEQHRKLKSRADEYILKPLTKEEVVAKAGQLLTLGSPDGEDDNGDIVLSADFSDEISIAEGDIVEEDAPAASERGSKSAGLFGGSEFDAIFDQETDAAFAAIQTAGEAQNPLLEMERARSLPPPPAMAPPPTPPPPAPPAVAAADIDDDWREEERTRATRFDDVDAGVSRAVTNGHSGSALEAPPVEEPAPYSVEADPSPSLEEISIAPGMSDSLAAEPAPEPPPAAPPAPVDDGRVKELEARLAETEAERTRLAADVEELRSRASSAPLSREKEVLNLREVINRKEKDVLDLRDALDAKDRQILDHKDRIRENERARRDLEEKMLGMEKSLMGANERLAALAHDKDKSNERERQLKARLDDAHAEIQKAHDEVDGLKRRLAATEEKSRADLERQRTELEARLHEAEENHREDIARLSDEKVAAEESIERQYEAKIAQITAEHAAELESREKRANEEQTAERDRHAGEVAKLRRDHEKALASAKEEQALQLAAERQAHQAAIEVKERDHKNEIFGMRRRHEEELRAAEERRQRELTDAEARRIEDLEGAETRRRQELQARDDEHHAKIAEMDRQHFDEKTAMAERHRSEMDQAHGRAARSEGELAARTEELSETQRRLSGTSADLDATRAELRDREVKLSQARDRVGELEAKVAELEEQILRAFQKLRADDKVVDRAKRALAIALTLLDERGATGAGGPQAPATAPAPSRPAEETT